METSYIIYFPSEDCFKVGYIKSGALKDKLKHYPEYEVVYTKSGYSKSWEASLLNSVRHYVPKTLKDKSNRELSGANTKFFKSDKDSILKLVTEKADSLYLYKSTIASSYYLSRIKLINADLIYTFNNINEQMYNEIMYQAKLRTRLISTYDYYIEFDIYHKSEKDFILEVESIRPMSNPVVRSIYSLLGGGFFFSRGERNFPNAKRVHTTRMEYTEYNEWVSWMRKSFDLAEEERFEYLYNNVFYIDDLEAVLDMSYINKTKILTEVLNLLEYINGVDHIKSLVKSCMD